jgi:predicted acylesterase/phospholipase RssA
MGLCAHLPFAEHAIDFDALPAIEPAFYVNAYNVSRGEMSMWGKDEINPDTLRAAFAFPFIYAPYQVDGDHYIEGAALKTLNFDALVSDDPREPGRHRDVDTLVVLDILSADKLIQPPRNLYDGWVRSIVTPLVQSAKNELRLFELEHNIDAATGAPKRTVLMPDLKRDIPDAHWPKVLDWSASNMRLLFDAGYAAAMRFCNEHGERLALSTTQPRAQPAARLVMQPVTPPATQTVTHPVTPPVMQPATQSMTQPPPRGGASELATQAEIV